MKFKSKNLLYTHLDNVHSENLNNLSPSQYYFNLKYKKDHGSCVICKKPTDWNEQAERYERFCKNPKCKVIYRDQFKKRMIDTYGKVHLLDDIQQQELMLANRKISGSYDWKHLKGSTRYVGQYEREFLEFLDLFMGWDPNDIMSPSPHVFGYSTEDGKSHLYIPDFYIPSLNLIIEIKDGGDNPNMHHKIQEVDKVKEKLKEASVKQNGIFNYVKVTNKDHESFVFYLADLKMHNISQIDYTEKEPLILINESSVANITPISSMSNQTRNISDKVDIDETDDIYEIDNHQDILLEDTVVKAVKRENYKQHGITRNLNYYINFLNTNLNENKLNNVLKEFKSYKKEASDTSVVSDALNLFEAKIIFEEIKKGKVLFDKIKHLESYYDKYKGTINKLHSKSTQIDEEFHKGVVYKDFKDDLDVQIDRIRRLQSQQKRVLKESGDSLLDLIKIRMKNIK